MDIEKINQWLSLLANIGVLAGIVFLAIELQQNTQMMQAQTRDSITDKQLAFLASVYGDPDTYAHWDTARMNPDLDFPLTGSDGLVHAIANANFRIWENEWYQYQQGLFTEEEFNPRLRMWASSLRQPAYPRVWQISRESFSPGFREQVDLILNDGDATIQ